MRENNRLQRTLLVGRTVLDIGGACLCAYVLGEVRDFVVQAEAISQGETEEITGVLQGFLSTEDPRCKGEKSGQ